MPRKTQKATKEPEPAKIPPDDSESNMPPEPPPTRSRRTKKEPEPAKMPPPPPRSRTRPKKSEKEETEPPTKKNHIKTKDEIEIEKEENDKYGAKSERALSESIIKSKGDNKMFLMEYGIKTLEELKTIDFSKYPLNPITVSLFTYVWGGYVSHTSYDINSYMRYPEVFEPQYQYMIEDTFLRLFNEFFEYRFDLDIDKEIKTYLSSKQEDIKFFRNETFLKRPGTEEEANIIFKQVAKECYQRRKTFFKDRYFKLNKYSIEESIEKNTDLLEKLKIIIHVLKQSFIFGRLAHDLDPEISFVRVTDGTESMYRGVTKLGCDEMRSITAVNPILNSFLSTSSDIQTAIFHTTNSPQNSTDDMTNSEKKIIIEYKFEPGITLVDIDKGKFASNNLAWQKEFIIPPGVKLEVIEECRDYPIQHIIDPDTLETLETDEQGRKLYINEYGITLPVEETVKYMKVLVSNPSAAKVERDLRIEDIEGKELGGKRMKPYSSKMRSKSNKKRRTYKIRK